MLDRLTALLATVQNGCAAFSLVAALTGVGGLGLIMLAVLATSWLPAFLRRPLIVAGIAIVVGAALYQAGQAKGAHEAFALDAARAIAAETARAEWSEKIAAAIAAQATRDFAAAQADNIKLKELNDALRTDPHRDRECLDRGLARRLREL